MHTFIYWCGVYFICSQIKEANDVLIDFAARKIREVKKKKHVEIHEKDGGLAVNGRHVGFERC